MSALHGQTPQASLLDLLDRLLDRGVVVNGDLRLTVAGVDLLEVGAKVMLASTETADRWRRGERRVFPETLVVTLPGLALTDGLRGREYLQQLRQRQVQDAADIAAVDDLAARFGATFETAPLRLGSAPLPLRLACAPDRIGALAAAIEAAVPAASIRRAADMEAGHDA